MTYLHFATTTFYVAVRFVFFHITCHICTPACRPQSKTQPSWPTSPRPHHVSKTLRTRSKASCSPAALPAYHAVPPCPRHPKSILFYYLFLNCGQAVSPCLSPSAVQPRERSILHSLRERERKRKRETGRERQDTIAAPPSPLPVTAFCTAVVPFPHPPFHYTLIVIVHLSMCHVAPVNRQYLLTPFPTVSMHVLISSHCATHQLPNVVETNNQIPRHKYKYISYSLSQQFPTLPDALLRVETLTHIHAHTPMPTTHCTRCNPTHQFLFLLSNHLLSVYTNKKPPISPFDPPHFLTISFVVLQPQQLDLSEQHGILSRSA